MRIIHKHLCYIVDQWSVYRLNVVECGFGFRRLLTIHMIESGFKHDKELNKFVKPQRKATNGDDALMRDEGNDVKDEKLFMGNCMKQTADLKPSVARCTHKHNGTFTLYDGMS